MDNLVDIEQEFRTYSDYEGMDCMDQLEVVKKANPMWRVAHMGISHDLFPWGQYPTKPYTKVLVYWQSISLPVAPFKNWSDEQ